MRLFTPIFSTIRGTAAAALIGALFIAVPTVQTAEAKDFRLKITAYDPNGERLTAESLLTLISREDTTGTASEKTISVSRPEMGSKPVASSLREEDGIVLVWKGPSRIMVGMPWPVKQDGFSTIWIDKEGGGYRDGDSILLNEEIALTQYRAYKKSLRTRLTDIQPLYKPGRKSKGLRKEADGLIDRAHRAEDPKDRAEYFDDALKSISLAWQKMLFEHGLQIANDDRYNKNLRFGLTLTDDFIQKIDDHEKFIGRLERTGTNWVRLIFKSNPEDFTYSERGSFQDYDPVVTLLREKGIKIMGTVLDTTQWPSTLTTKEYAERTRNLLIHYRKQIRSWDIGNEINGDWLGGRKNPLGVDKTFRIMRAGLRAAKTVESSIETVVTLYWWDSTAPDWEHSLFGWLKHYVPRGFGDDLDVVALSLQPHDNPVGTAFDGIFTSLREALPRHRLMLGSFGYVEEDTLKGYWWLHPDDVDGARKDLIILYTASSCAMPNSLCGGFWFQTTGQILKLNTRPTDLYRIYHRALRRLGR